MLETNIYIEYSSIFFFFQAEDGIRDHCVTGVQTCALPISSRRLHTSALGEWSSDVYYSDHNVCTPVTHGCRMPAFHRLDVTDIDLQLNTQNSRTAART